MLLLILVPVMQTCYDGIRVKYVGDTKNNNIDAFEYSSVQHLLYSTVPLFASSVCLDSSIYLIVMKYSSVLQHSEEDCGAACLATIAKHYGRTLPINRAREVIGTGQLGTTLLGLRRGAETLGFYARAVKASPELMDCLDKAPLPAIIHWKGHHWVVLYGKTRKHYVVADPGVGVRYLTRQELVTAWANGVMLLLQLDDARFYAQPQDEIQGLYSGNFNRNFPGCINSGIFFA